VTALGRWARESLLPQVARPVALQAIWMALDPEGFFESCVAQRGDPFVLGIPSAGEVLVSGHPEAARDLFTASSAAIEPVEPNPVAPLLGAHSLLLLSGERHRRERRLMMAPFNARRMGDYGGIIRDRTLAAVRTWRPGEVFVAQHLTQAITLDVILRAVIGVQGEPRSARFRDSIKAMLAAYTPLLLVLPALRRSFGPFGPWVRFAAARDNVCALFREEIAARRAAGDAARNDILSLLMAARYEDDTQLTDEELVDELRTLVVAGHDTTSTALVWALFHVHRDPQVLGTLRDELATLGPFGEAPPPDRLAELPYLGAVCQEALRLHPVVPIIPRRACQPMIFRGHAIAPGQNIAIATTLLHTHPEVWTDPARFSPERFLERKYSPFEYAPFGGGVRRCIGAALGTYQLRIVLGTLLATTRLTLRTRRTPARVLMNITMGPREAVRLQVEG